MQSGALGVATQLIWQGLDTDARRDAGLGAAAMLASALCTMSAASALAIGVANAAASDAPSAPWIMLAVAGAVAGQGFDALKWRCHSLAEQRMETAITARVFDAALEAAPSTQSDHPLGARMQELVNALIGCRLLFQHILFTAPSALIGAIIGSGFLVALGRPGLGALMAAFAPAYLAASLWRSRLLGAAAQATTQARLKAAGRFGDGLLNREAIRLFAAKRYVASGVARALGDVQRKARLLVSVRLAVSLIAALVFALIYGASLWLAFDSASAQRIRLLVLVNACVLSLMRPLELAAQALRDLLLAQALVAPLANLPHGVRGQIVSDVSVGWGEGAAVSFEGVSFAYPERTPILQNASFTIPSGAVVGLSGASGAGKSTIARLLTSALAPSGGIIRIDGSALAAHVVAEYASLMAVAPQEVLLLDDTIAANIAFGRRACEAELARAVSIVGLEPLLARLPNGLGSRVGERGGLLSGGERQRVALARALLKPARLYIFDEATSALDPESELEITRRIGAALHGATILVIAHRRTAFGDFDLVLTLDGGAISATQGPRLASLSSADIAPSLPGRGPHNPAART